MMLRTLTNTPALPHLPFLLCVGLGFACPVIKCATSCYIVQVCGLTVQCHLYYSKHNLTSPQPPCAPCCPGRGLVGRARVACHHQEPRPQSGLGMRTKQSSGCVTAPDVGPASICRCCFGATCYCSKLTNTAPYTEGLRRRAKPFHCPEGGYRLLGKPVASQLYTEGAQHRARGPHTLGQRDSSQRPARIVVGDSHLEQEVA